LADLSLRSVEKTFGATGVLRGITAQIEDGQFVALVGPSGCGKSTLLRMIAGLETVSDGEIVLGGRVINDIRPQERNIAMVFQNYALYPHMTVRENIGFSFRFRGVSKRDRAQRIRETAEIVELGDLLDRYPRELSGGQRQRVAMGRAIARQPDVFLFDEPLSNLDAKLRVQMRKEIKSLHQRLGSTIVYVTHDQIEAMTMANKVIVMRDGVIEQMAAPLELYDDPDNLFVASFIGSPSINLIAGEVEGTDPAAFRGLSGITFDLPPIVQNPVPKQVVLGIRPDHLTLNPRSDFRASVNVVEPMGAQTQVYAEVAGQEIVLMLNERFAAVAGDMIGLSLMPGKALLFDAASGVRIR
jgi:multiple sugar transport system ATP-binding protein